MKKNLLKKLVAFVLVFVLALSTAAIVENPIEVQAATKTVKKNGFTYNKLPYKSNGLTVSKLTFSDGYCTAIIKNETGKAIANTSRIPCTCYNKNGDVLDTGNLYLQMCNKGETCVSQFAYPEDTVKVLFGEAVVRADDNHKKSAKTKKVNGIKITKLPATFSKVKFTKASVEKIANGSKLTLTYTNGTGKPMKELSSLLIKCYNKDGQVVNSGIAYLKDLNNGDKATVDITLYKDVTEVHLLDVDVREGEASVTVKTHDVNGVETNVTPYTRDGLTIESISFDGRKATLKVTNNTGKSISGSSGFNYKAYDDNGEAINSSIFYLEHMNQGESCITYSYIGSSTDTIAKVVFDTTKIYELEKEIPSVSKFDTVEGLKMNKLPYTNNGLEVDFYEKNSHTYSCTIKNNTGKAIRGPKIYYRAFDEDGCIIDSGSIYGQMMDNGEISLCSFVSKDDWARVEMYAADYTEMKAFGTIKTATIDGITTNKVPYSNDKLKITDISFDKGYSSFDAKVVIQNNTGADLKADNYLWYKCYDENGYVVDSRDKYPPDIKKGESAVVDINYISDKVVKIIFQLVKD